MKKVYGLLSICIGFACIVSSCQKMAGHAVSPASSSGTGIGTIAVGASGTFIYQVGTGPIVTYITPNVGFIIGTDTVRNIPATAIIASNPATNSSFILAYSGTSVGTYDMQAGLTSPTLNKQSTYGAQKTNISFQNTGSTSSNSSFGTGTIKGTFTGTMTDVSGANPVSVQGSFNITQ